MMDLVNQPIELKMVAEFENWIRRRKNWLRMDAQMCQNYPRLMINQWIGNLTLGVCQIKLEKSYTEEYLHDSRS